MSLSLLFLCLFVHLCFLLFISLCILLSLLFLCLFVHLCVLLFISLCILLSLLLLSLSLSVCLSFSLTVYLTVSSLALSFSVCLSVVHVLRLFLLFVEVFCVHIITWKSLWGLKCIISPLGTSLRTIYMVAYEQNQPSVAVSHIDIL